MKIYTIGHSTHDQETFLNMLQNNNIEVLADIRSYPGSRRCPQFNKEIMPAWLYECGVEYIHIPKLGGRRNNQHIVSPNEGWRNASFKNYADYALSSEFREGLHELMSIAKTKRTAYMCSESCYWRCHRWIVSDVLSARGIEVVHISDCNHNQFHRINTLAHVEGMMVTYPGNQMTIEELLFVNQ